MPSKKMLETCLNKAEAYEREGNSQEAERWLKMAILCEQRIKEEGETNVKVVNEE